VRDDSSGFGPLEWILTHTGGNIMAHPIAAWQGGIHSLVEAALAPNGTLFQRYQKKDPRYGYVWSKWQPKRQIDPQNPPTTLEAGFSTLYRADSYSAWQKWRLPA
jgi:hypothetical protein